MNPDPVVLFDGPCILCQRSVRFLLRHEREPRLSFASLQSGTAQQLLEKYPLPSGTDAMVLIEEGQLSIGSEAALRLCRYLKAPWRWLGVFRHLPGWLHQPVYRWIARHRYAWFGRDESCPLPDPEQADRFL